MILRFFIFIGIFTTASFAEVMYVLPNKAKLMDSPTMGSTALLEIPHGNKVTVEKIDGIWMNVSYKNNSGWICKFNLSSTDPKKDSIIESLSKTDLKKNARRRASSYSTAATSRGLTEMDEKIHSDANYDALKQMMAYKPKQKDVHLFMIEGGLIPNEND